MIKHIHRIGFHHAWDGIVVAFSNHPNFRIHAAITIVVGVLGFVLGITRIEWIILTSVITFGFVIEMINTAIESVVDLVTEEWRLHAKIAKDVASGAMLLAAVGASCVGILVFYPYLAQ